MEGASDGNGSGERSLDHLTLEGDEHQVLCITMCEPWMGSELWMT